MADKELFDQKMKRGLVIDNISSGKARFILDILRPSLNNRVLVALNVESKFGKKDIIKIEGKHLSSKEIDLISLVSPRATINILENGEVKEKRTIKLPKIIEGVFRCPNLSCETNVQYYLQTKFKVLGSEIERQKLQCSYCGAYLSSRMIMDFLKSIGVEGSPVSKKKIEKVLLDILVEKGALKIASSLQELFILKSGRSSAYFINIGSLTDGNSLSNIKWTFANYIALILNEKKLEDFDFIFGPAYKGINLATLACEGLSELFGINKRYLYDRKEEKVYGDVSADKVIVGANHFKEGQKILIIDDVTTTGETKIESLEKLKLLGFHKVVGILILVDRQEKMGDLKKIGKKSAADYIQEKFGVKVFSILTSKTIFDQVKDSLPGEVKQYWIDYYTRYGAVKLD